MGLDGIEHMFATTTPSEVRGHEEPGQALQGSAAPDVLPFVRCQTEPETVDAMSARLRPSHRHLPPRRAWLAVTAVLVASATVGAAVSSGRAGAQPAGQYFGSQWGLTQIGAPSAWASGTGAGVRIGIVDTGVDASQQDLAGKVVASADCIGGTCVGGGADDEGHGTHVAGIAAGSGQFGISGVAPSASLVVAKALDSSGSGSLSDIAAGIAWVVQHGARVVNLSIGSDPGFAGLDCALGGCDVSTLETAADDAWNAGAIPVIAAGNNGGTLDLIAPAGYGSTHAVIVAATGKDATLAGYSSTTSDAAWAVAAPGGYDPNGPSAQGCDASAFDPQEIVSTYWVGPPNSSATNATNCYATDEGTSMATPFVVGTLALLLGRGLSQGQALQVLLDTAHPSPAGQGAGWCGANCRGLIDAGAAMAAANRMLPSPGPAALAPNPAPLAAGGSTSVSGVTLGALDAGGPTTAAPTTTTGGSVSRTRTDALRASTHDHGRSGLRWMAPLLVVAAVACAAVVFERHRRRAQLTRPRAMTMHGNGELGTAGTRPRGVAAGTPGGDLP
jgi:subtilisin family serine protease